MATENVNDEQAGDAFDTLTAKLAQLQAMLNMTYGNSAETFSAMNDKLRDSYLWACTALVDDCVDLTHKFVPKGF
jgi:hypothetical protein